MDKFFSFSVIATIVLLYLKLVGLPMAWVWVAVPLGIYLGIQLVAAAVLLSGIAMILILSIVLGILSKISWEG